MANLLPSFRGRQGGGWRTEGGGKPHEGQAPPKRGFGPPPPSGQTAKTVNGLDSRGVCCHACFPRAAVLLSLGMRQNRQNRETLHTPYTTHPPCRHLDRTPHECFDFFSGALKGTEPRGQIEPKRRFSCRSSPFPTLAFLSLLSLDFLVFSLRRIPCFLRCFSLFSKDFRR